MKRLLVHLAHTRYRVYLLGALILLLLTSVPLHADKTIHTDEQLFDIAYQAYAKKDWVRAAMYLTAYIERAPDLMWRDSSHTKQVRDAWAHSEQQAKDLERVNSILQQKLNDCNRRCSSGLSSSVSGLTMPPPSLSNTVPVKPQSYPLVCRGGGNLHFQYTPYSNLSKKPQIWIIFQKGQRGVGQNWENVHDLAPGQCSWLDRSIYPNEPNRITILYPIIGPDDFSISWQNGRVTGISSALTYINALQSPDQFQSFDIYNDGQGNFVVTQVGLVAPAQIAPASGTVFNHYPRTTTLRWAPVAGATKYVVQVDCFHCCKAGAWCTDVGKTNYGQQSVTNTQYTFNFVGAQPGRWRVWAVGADGRAGPKSAWWEFRYTK